MRDAADRLIAATELRRVELGKRWKQVYEEAGLTHQTLNRWRKGHPVDPLTERALEGALRWGPGAREAIAADEQPVPLDEGAVRSVHEAPAKPPLSVTQEVLRAVVGAVAKALELRPSEVDAVLPHVRRDLERAEPPIPASETARTDLSDMVREARLSAGLSLEDVASRTSDTPGIAAALNAGWLDRLERATLTPDEFPEYPQLDALARALPLDPGRMQEAAGVQFMDVHTIWSEDGQTRALVVGELDAADRDKMDVLMRLYRRTPKK